MTQRSSCLAAGLWDTVLFGLNSGSKRRQSYFSPRIAETTTNTTDSSAIASAIIVMISFMDNFFGFKAVKSALPSLNISPELTANSNWRFLFRLRG